MSGLNESDCWSFGMICPCAIATVAARTWNAEKKKKKKKKKEKTEIERQRQKKEEKQQPPQLVAALSAHQVVMSLTA